MASYIKASLERAYAETFLADLESNTNQYFLFIGKGTTWADGSSDNSPPAYFDTVNSEYSVMNEIIGYKKLSPENVIFALKRVLWTSGTKYDQYDDRVDLSAKNYYVVTEDNHIYKCIENGNGAASTVKPTVLSSYPFKTSDGYKWKYMATVKESNLPYELTDYVPIEFVTLSTDTETQNQYNTQLSAINGSIDRMAISYPSGTNPAVYPAAITATRMNRPSAIQVASLTKISEKRKVVRITDSVSKTEILKQSINDYVNSMMRVVFSPAPNISEVNNYGVIVGASLVGSNNDIEFTVENDVIDFTFTVTGTPVGVEILPFIKIVGDGEGCYAFPVMNSNLRIQSIDVVDGGKGYSQTLIDVVSYKSTNTTHPTITATISPKGGHGSNILQELGVKDVLVIIEVTEEDSDKILGGGNYRQFGIIKNPLLNNNTNTIAGKGEETYRDIELIPSSATDPSHFDLSPNNFITGSESFSSSKIVDVKSQSVNSVLLKVKNTSGSFISRQDRPNDYILEIGPNFEIEEEPSGTINSFALGETVTQTIPANTPFGLDSITFGYDFVVEGIVVAKTKKAIIVRVTSNANFVVSEVYKVVGNTTNTSGTILSVMPRYGEDVWISNTQGGLASFITDDEGNQLLYRISSVGPGYYDLNRVPSYSGLHLLRLSTSLSGACGGMDTTSAPLSPSTFSNGDVVHQGVTGQFGHYARGTVYYWDYINPARGNLYLTNVYGSFKSVDVDGLTGTQLREYVVGSVEPPEILRTSGEIIYINNIRPISRFAGQQEEFRIRLGF